MSKNVNNDVSKDPPCGERNIADLECLIPRNINCRFGLSLPSLSFPCPTLLISLAEFIFALARSLFAGYSQAKLAHMKHGSYLMTVGKSSAAYTYTASNEMNMKNLANIAMMTRPAMKPADNNNISFYHTTISSSLSSSSSSSSSSSPR